MTPKLADKSYCLLIYSLMHVRALYSHSYFDCSASGALPVEAQHHEVGLNVCQLSNAYVTIAWLLTGHGQPITFPGTPDQAPLTSRTSI